MKKIKQTLNLLTTAVITISLVACGGGNKDTTSVIIKPKTTTIKGDLGDYFEVVDKEYTIKVEDPEGLFQEGTIFVEVKRNHKDFTFNSDKLNPFGTNGEEDYHFGFGIEFLTDAGPALVRAATDDYYLPREECISLMKLKKGETGYLSWSIEQTKFDGLKTFELSSAMEKSEQSSVSSSSDGNNSSAGSSQDCDKFIKDYEAFVNSYIKLLKKYKANPTDASILTEYTEAAQEAIEMQTNATDCNDAKYVSKLLELANKMAQAIL